MPTNDALLRDLGDSRIETTFLGDIVKHVINERARSKNERRVQREERWVRQKRLGRGTYGAVYLQKRHEVGAETLRAVKEIQKCATPGKDFEYFQEIEAIMKFSHVKYQHCFVTSHGWYEDEDTVYIAMEFMELGDLGQYLTQALPEPEAIQIVAQVLEGLTFMHDNGFIHRDLKPANIMVDATAPNWFVKIADFGISRRRQKDATMNLTAVGGTLGYVAPEALGIGKRSYTCSVDMWSLGAVAYKMLTNSVPFDGFNEIAQYAYGQTGFPKDSKAFRSISADGQEFIANLMQLNPHDRRCAESATKHPWLAQYLEMQPGVTKIDSVFESGNGPVEKDVEIPSSTSCPTEVATHVDADEERTIRAFYGNYKSPFVSECLDESKMYGGEKLAIDSKYVLEGPLRNMHNTPTSIPSHVFNTGDDSGTLTRTPRTLSRQVSLGPGAEIRQCVVCKSGKFDFKCSSGHFMCTSCFNQELRLSFSNPKNVTHKCCISSSTHSEESQGTLFPSTDMHSDVKVGSNSDQANKDKPTVEPNHRKTDGAMNHGNNSSRVGTTSQDVRTPSDESKLGRCETNQAHKHNGQDDLYGCNSEQNPASDENDIFEGSGAYYEEYDDPSLDHDSDSSYESDELPSEEETQSRQTKANSQNVTCQNCKSDRAPVETLPCKHRICHACIVQFLALSLISPKFMNISCCDYPLDQIGDYCWRKILLDPRLNAAWERLKLVDKGWTCSKGHPPKDGSPLVTCGPVPIWRQAVKCSGCLPSTSVLRGSDTRHFGNANFCLFCSKEVGSGGCKSCDHDRVAWEFISRLKRSRAFRVRWMAEDVREACEVKKRMNRGQTLDYETLEEFKRGAEAAEPESRSQSPPHTQKEPFVDPNTAYSEPPRPFAQYHHPPRQNRPYFYPQPYPNYAPHTQNFYHNAPQNWAPNYPPPNSTSYYDMHGQRTHSPDPYYGAEYGHGSSTRSPYSVISCCYCAGNHIVHSTDKIIQCACGGRMCGVCYGPFGPCRSGCVHAGGNASFYAYA